MMRSLTLKHKLILSGIGIAVVPILIITTLS